MHRSKLYRSQSEKIDCAKLYNLREALKMLKEMPHVKFDQTVELAFKLGIDPKQTDQNVRGAIPLPKGTGKKVVVAVIASDASAEEAKKAGADFVGLDELVDKIKGGWVEFDVLIATPAAMPMVRPLGRALGPKGLMPNPKTGTVTDHVGKAVTEAKAGRVEFKNDRGACIHVPVGKLSFKAEDLEENGSTIIHAIMRAKPSTAKGIFMQSCTMSSTMSPGIKIDIKEFVKVTS
ncbi:MAG: 50S ribosomal protein L1 [Lentisphaerae bacterium GWF2_44_16]|nr:MAG: 50S ribosomal protein L1 [Lentisphaerae bacterium GWF2_44_16]